MDAALYAALMDTCKCDRSLVEDDDRHTRVVRWWTNPLCPDHGHLNNDAWDGIPDGPH